LRKNTLLGLWLVCAGLSTWGRPSLAQSAADKATARNLATEGIELFREGRYSDALDRLQRAEALFHAPVHLLYIARSQAELGLLVEASETYKRLLRADIGPDAPGAFLDAVRAAEVEAPELEARIPALRIQITPSGVDGLTLTIDGNEVSSAVVGIDRPANPGRRVVIASAPGFAPARKVVELGEGEQGVVDLQLIPLEREPAAPEPLSPPPDDPDAAREPPKLGFIAGVRLGAAIPTGRLLKGEATAMSDYAGPGGALELSVGATFARYFGAKLYLQGVTLTSPRAPALTFAQPFEPGSVAVESRVRGRAIGFAVIAGTPPGRLGGFGELGITVYEELEIERELRFTPSQQCGESARQTLRYWGPALRVGGGARLPVHRLVHVSLFANISLGGFRRGEVETSCAALPNPPGMSDADLSSLGDDRRAGHQMILWGLEGELLIGLR